MSGPPARLPHATVPRSIALQARFLVGAFVLAVGAIVLVLINEAPQHITVVERVREGAGPSLLDVDDWRIEGAGALGRAPTVGLGAAPELRLDKAANAEIRASIAFDGASSGVLRLFVLPETPGTSLEISLNEAGVGLIEVPLDGVTRGTATAPLPKGGERYAIDRWTEIALWWRMSERDATYALRVGGTTVADAAPLGPPGVVDGLALTVTGNAAGAWRVAQPVMVRGTGIDLGQVPDEAQVRLVGVDGREIATSAPTDPNESSEQTIPLPIDPQPFPARFELFRDGSAIAAPSPIVFDVTPGDSYRVGTQVDPIAGDVHTQLDMPRVAGIVSVLAAIAAFFATARSIGLVSVAFGVLAYAALRVLAIEILLGVGLPLSPLNRAVIAIALGGALVVANADRLAARAGAAFKVAAGLRRPTSAGWIAGAVVVAGIAALSALAVARVPTPEDAAQYAYVGGRWLQQGELPFIDQYADKSPGLFLIYGLFADLAGHGLRSLLITRLLVTGLIVALGSLLAYRLGGRAGALLGGGALALVVSWLQFGGDAPRAAEIGLLPLLVALLLLDQGRRRKHPAADLAAGAYLGAAVLTSAQSLYALPVMVLWLWPDRHTVGVWGRTTRLAAAGAAVAAVALAYFAAKGAIEPMYTWWIERSVTHVDFWLQSHVLEAEPGLDFFLWIPATYGPVYLAIGAVFLALLASRRWWAAAVVGVAAVTQHASIKPLYRFEEHDYIVLSWVLLLGIALLARDIRWPPRLEWRLAIRGAGLASAGALVGVAVIPTQLDAFRSPPGNDFDRQAPVIAAELQESTPDDRLLFIWNNNVQIPWLLDSPVSGGWNQTHSADNNPSGREEWVASIVEELPDAVVTPGGIGDTEFREVQAALQYRIVETGAEAYEVYLRSPSDLELRHETPGCRLITQATSQELGLGSGATFDFFPASIQVVHAFVRAAAGAGPLVLDFQGTEGHSMTLTLDPDGGLRVDGELVADAGTAFESGADVSLELVGLDGARTYSLFVDGQRLAEGSLDVDPSSTDGVQVSAAAEWSVRFDPSFHGALENWVSRRAELAGDTVTHVRKQYDVPLGRVLAELELPTHASLTIAVGLAENGHARLTLSPDGMLHVPNAPAVPLDVPDDGRLRVLLSAYEAGPATLYDVYVNDVPIFRDLTLVSGDVPDRMVQFTFHDGSMHSTSLYGLLIAGRGGITVRNVPPRDILQLEHEPGDVVGARAVALHAGGATLQMSPDQVFEHGHLSVRSGSDLDQTYRSHHINNFCPGDVYALVRR